MCGEHRGQKGQIHWTLQLLAGMLAPPPLSVVNYMAKLNCLATSIFLVPLPYLNPSSLDSTGHVRRMHVLHCSSHKSSAKVPVAMTSVGCAMLC